jgi:hypothetical protein
MVLTFLREISLKANSFYLALTKYNTCQFVIYKIIFVFLVPQ